MCPSQREQLRCGRHRDTPESKQVRAHLGTSSTSGLVEWGRGRLERVTPDFAHCPLLAVEQGQGTCPEPFMTWSLALTLTALPESPLRTEDPQTSVIWPQPRTVQMEKQTPSQ